MKSFNHILIFKTNVNCHNDKQLLHNLLDDDPAIESWTIDMEDEDCVLRVVSHQLAHCQIIELLNNNSLYCCELI